MAATHEYDVAVGWTGNLGAGTDGYRSFSRAHEVAAPGKPVIPGSADPAFRGDPARWNPEELLIASVAQCHMLWYLHLCATAKVVVTEYRDRAHGVLTMDAAGGGGRITGVVLRPEVVVAEAEMIEKARDLHGEVHRVCFVARSVDFPVTHRPEIRAAG